MGIWLLQSSFCAGADPLPGPPPSERGREQAAPSPANSDSRGRVGEGASGRQATLQQP